jgi:hypothetical protein
MGIIKAWRQLKVLKAVGQAANEAAAQDSPVPSRPSQGMAAGFFNVMADALAPWMAAMAERRGGPLPGSDRAVIDGSAWTGSVAVGAAAVQARDAAFDSGLLAAFAEQVFAATVAVWAGADAGSIRPVMSDALWAPLAAATGVGKGPDRFAQPGHQRATARLAGLHAGAWYDSARVAMHVTLVGHEQQLPAPLPPEMAEWDEEWLFQRSARPGGDPMIRPLACPSCGAPTKADDQDLCLHCREPVPYLTTGWLVTEIVSRHPAHAQARERMAASLRANPEAIARVPPSMRGLIPPDRQAGSGLPPDSPR